VKRIMLLVLTTFMIVLILGCSAENAKQMEEDMKVIDKKTVKVENEENTDVANEEAVQLESEEDMDAIDDETVNVENEEKAATADETEAEAELVTREQIIEHFGFSEEELEEIDVDAVIKYNKSTEEELKDFSKEEYLHYMKRTDEKIKTDIGYLFEGGQPDGKIPFSQIKTIVLFENKGKSVYYWNILVRDKKAYYCMSYNDNMDLEENCVFSGTLTDKYLSELQSCLDKANLHKWKAKYEGSDENAIGGWCWRFGIELTDGTVYSWRGGGMFGDNQPEEYQSVEEVVDSMYEKCPIKINENSMYARYFKNTQNEH